MLQRRDCSVITLLSPFHTTESKVHKCWRCMYRLCQPTRLCIFQVYANSGENRQCLVQIHNTMCDTAGTLSEARPSVGNHCLRKINFFFSTSFCSFFFLSFDSETRPFTATLLSTTLPHELSNHQQQKGTTAENGAVHAAL